MISSRLLSLVVLLCCLSGCESPARPPLIIEVLDHDEGAPYSVNNELHTLDSLKRMLEETNRGSSEFSKPVTQGSWPGGLIMRPKPNVPFTSVMKLLEHLKEWNITAYSIESTYQKDPKTRTELMLPVYSAKLKVNHQIIEQTPGKPDALSPQKRIQEITEQMGGRLRK